MCHEYISAILLEANLFLCYIIAGNGNQQSLGTQFGRFTGTGKLFSMLAGRTKSGELGGLTGGNGFKGYNIRITMRSDH